MAKTALMSKRAAFLWLAMGLVAGLLLSNAFSLGSTALAQEDAVSTGFEEVRTDVLEANFVPGTSRMETDVWFRGSGFLPDTPISVLIEDSNGVLTDISVPAEERRDGGGSVENLTANEDGAWATSWRIGRFTREGVGAEGMYSVVVVDGDFNQLATTPLALCNLTDRPEEEEPTPTATAEPTVTPIPGTPLPPATATAEPSPTATVEPTPSPAEVPSFCSQ